MPLDLSDKTVEQRADLKADEMVRIGKPETFEDKQYGITVEVQSVQKYDAGSIEVLARAWKDGEPCGFGIDGSIEIERFRFVNPPMMVPDGTYTTKEYEGEKYEEQNYVEDPAEALRLALVDTINVVANDGKNIVPGKIGSTTTTVFATYGAMVYYSGVDQTWATVHDAATGTNVDTTDNRWVCRIDCGTIAATQYNLISRWGGTFDTSGIPDTDVISAATLSIFGSATTNTNTDSPDVRANVYDFTPASDATYVTADYDQFGTTAFATSIAFASWSTSAYNVFTLNASGIADITKTGNTVLGVREATFDVTNTPLVGVSSNAIHRFGYRNYTATGTTNDPKLVVTHAAPTTAIKTINDLAVASVKTVNGLAIASVKNINGLA